MYSNIDRFVQGFAEGGGVGFERGRGSMYDSYPGAKRKKEKEEEEKEEKSFPDYGPPSVSSPSAYEISEALGGDDRPSVSFPDYGPPSVSSGLSAYEISEALGGGSLDPLTAYGRRDSDPRVFLDNDLLESTGGPRFLPITGQIYTSEPMSSAVGGLIDDHEYRHLALNELRNVMGQRNPAENIYKYGQPMMDAVNSVLNFSGSVNQYNKMPTLEEKFVELFDPPALDEGPYGGGHLSDPNDIFSRLAMVTEDAGSSQLQSPELRGGVQDVLAGRMSMDDFLSLPQVQEVGKIIDENTGNFRQQFLESINDPRQIMPVMQGLGTFLDRLSAPRAATGETRPEFSDAERLLNYYKSQTGEGYSSQRNPYKSEEEKARVGQMLFNMKDDLGFVLGRHEVNPNQFEEIMFPTNTNNNVSMGIGSFNPLRNIEQGSMQVRETPLDIQDTIDFLNRKKFLEIKDSLSKSFGGAQLEYLLDKQAKELNIERPDK
jgi:hypothetical protein